MVAAGLATGDFSGILDLRAQRAGLILRPARPPPDRFQYPAFLIELKDVFRTFRSAPQGGNAARVPGRTGPARELQPAARLAGARLAGAPAGAADRHRPQV